MPRNIVQDVIPRGDRRSITKIPVRESIPLPLPVEEFPEESERDTTEPEPVEDILNSDKPEPGFRFQKPVDDSSSWGYGRPSGHSHWFLWVIGVLSTAALIFVLGSLFSGATVTVTPRSENLAVNLDLEAKEKPALGEFGYTVYTLVRDKEKIVPADGERPIQSKASGTIIVYNDYSAVSQRLVKNTRFETPSGLIYKIANSITIPGRHLVAGETVPGSVEAVVYAETAGEEYNIGMTDFTIPGFKSNPDRFSNFYGRSKTAMTGGKIGTEKFVSDEKSNQTRTEIDAELVKELVANAMADVPPDSVFYDGAYRVNFEPTMSSSKVTGNNMPVAERAYFTAFFLKRSDLGREIAENLVKGYDDTPVEIINPTDLKFTPKEPQDKGETVAGVLSFNLRGAGTIIWQFDEGKLKNELAGKAKSDLGEVVGKYSSILKAEAVIRPFWTRTFPKSADKIKFQTEDSTAK